mmetsp:Transcript_39902/g.113969  ORF Transcript_39902/g.113969 Transcript_39902/m.113969 type:complete len:282 (-) Transcript_39902:1019-1864(-)
MPVGLSCPKRLKKGWWSSSGVKTSTCRSMSNGSDKRVRSSTSFSSTLCWPRRSLCSRCRRMRTARGVDIFWKRRKRWKMRSCFAYSLFMFRSCVMAFVIELTNEENVTMAKTRVMMEKVRSCTFCGYTSIDAGVNCVRDQCSEVVYLYSTEAFSMSTYWIHVRLGLELTSEATSKVPMAYHRQATKWLITRMQAVSFKMPIMTTAYSDWMCSSRRTKYFGSFMSRRRRRSRRIRMTRTVLPNLARPRLSMPPAALVSSPSITTSIHSIDTRKKSSGNQVRR